jgi:hypothetical protein
MEYNTTSRSNAAHAARLDRTVQELQTRVKEQETALEKVDVYFSDNAIPS